LKYKTQTEFPINLSDLLTSDGLIKDVLLENDLDFDLWDIDNLQAPPEAVTSLEQAQQWQVADQPAVAEVKLEPIAPQPVTLTHPNLIVTPIVTTSAFQQQQPPQPQQHLQQPVTTIVNSIESPTIRNLLTRNNRVQDLMNGQKIIFHPIGSNVTGNTILVSSNGQPLLLQVRNNQDVLFW
jgi:hypothetical protein